MQHGPCSQGRAGGRGAGKPTATKVIRTAIGLQEWRCLRCGELTLTLRFRSYESILHGTLDSFDVKRLCADGAEPGPNTRGLTIARPVRVESVTSIGPVTVQDVTAIK
jgi:hypothetical protein